MFIPKCTRAGSRSFLTILIAISCVLASSAEISHTPAPVGPNGSSNRAPVLSLFSPECEQEKRAAIACIEAAGKNSPAAVSPGAANSRLQALLAPMIGKPEVALAAAVKMLAASDLRGTCEQASQSLCAAISSMPFDKFMGATAALNAAGIGLNGGRDLLAKHPSVENDPEIIDAYKQLATTLHSKWKSEGETAAKETKSTTNEPPTDQQANFVAIEQAKQDTIATRVFISELRHRTAPGQFGETDAQALLGELGLDDAQRAHFLPFTQAQITATRASLANDPDLAGVDSLEKLAQKFRTTFGTANALLSDVALRGFDGNPVDGHELTPLFSDRRKGETWKAADNLSLMKMGQYQRLLADFKQGPLGLLWSTSAMLDEGLLGMGGRSLRDRDPSAATSEDINHDVNGQYWTRASAERIEKGAEPHDPAAQKTFAERWGTFAGPASLGGAAPSGDPLRPTDFFGRRPLGVTYQEQQYQAYTARASARGATPMTPQEFVKALMRSDYYQAHATSAAAARARKLAPNPEDFETALASLQQSELRDYADGRYSTETLPMAQEAARKFRQGYTGANLSSPLDFTDNGKPDTVATSMRRREDELAQGVPHFGLTPYNTDAITAQRMHKAFDQLLASNTDAMKKINAIGVKINSKPASEQASLLQDLFEEDPMTVLALGAKHPELADKITAAVNGVNRRKHDREFWRKEIKDSLKVVNVAALPFNLFGGSVLTKTALLSADALLATGNAAFDGHELYSQLQARGLLERQISSHNQTAADGGERIVQSNRELRDSTGKLMLDVAVTGLTGTALVKARAEARALSATERQAARGITEETRMVDPAGGGTPNGNHGLPPEAINADGTVKGSALLEIYKKGAGVIDPATLRRIENFEKSGGTFILDTDGTAGGFNIVKGKPRIRFTPDYIQSEGFAEAFAHELDHYTRVQRYARKLQESARRAGIKVPTDAEALNVAQVRVMKDQNTFLASHEQSAVDTQRRTAPLAAGEPDFYEIYPELEGMGRTHPVLATPAQIEAWKVERATLAAAPSGPNTARDLYYLDRKIRRSVIVDDKEFSNVISGRDRIERNPNLFSPKQKEVLMAQEAHFISTLPQPYVRMMDQAINKLLKTHTMEEMQTVDFVDDQIALWMRQSIDAPRDITTLYWLYSKRLSVLGPLQKLPGRAPK